MSTRAEPARQPRQEEAPSPLPEFGIRSPLDSPCNKDRDSSGCNALSGSNHELACWRERGLHSLRPGKRKWWRQEKWIRFVRHAYHQRNGSCLFVSNRRLPAFREESHNCREPILESAVFALDRNFH